MTTAALCAHCAGDPADGTGYHAYDCPEVAPKERQMTTNEHPLGELEQSRERIIESLDSLAMEMGEYENRASLHDELDDFERAVRADERDRLHGKEDADSCKGAHRGW